LTETTKLIKENYSLSQGNASIISFRRSP